MTDIVTHPPHYTQGAVECIEALEAIGVARDYCRGNAIKYLWRLNDKGKTLEDARKAQWYVNKLVEYLTADYERTCPTTSTSSSSASPPCASAPTNTRSPSTPPPAPSSCDSCDDSSHPYHPYQVLSH